VGSILVVDDDREVAESHAKLLRKIGYSPRLQSVPEQVEPDLARHPDTSLVLLDIRMPGLSGIDLLDRIKVRHPEIGIVMATVVNDVTQAVQAIKGGAYNYLLKPLQEDEVRRVLGSYFSNQPQPLIDEPRFRPFITGHAAFREIFRRIQAFAQTDVPVLLQGETGTGKELIAALIHALSPRSENRFLPVNIASLSATLFESELFGHVRGAFSGAVRDRAGYFEEAQSGTLFLDEIGELPEEQQRRLLRVIEARKFTRVGESTERDLKARVVMATHRDLQVQVKEGKFRQDLYYRISPYEVRLPPLRERPGDIELLVRYFTAKYASQFGRQVNGCSPEALSLLLAYSFPGNVRELEGMISAAVLLEQSSMLQPGSLPTHLSLETNSGGDLEKARCQAVMRALGAANGNQTQAAKSLGIARQTLNYLLREYRERGWIG
jgi:DNA-binding NtrC family response regulator